MMIPSLVLAMAEPDSVPPEVIAAEFRPLQVMVSVKIDGRPGKLLLDTGSPTTILLPSAGRTKDAKVRIAISPRTEATLSVEVKESKTVRDIKGADGILGLDYLDRYIVGLDPTDQLLVVWPTGTDVFQAAAFWFRHSYVRPPGWPPQWLAAGEVLDMPLENRRFEAMPRPLNPMFAVGHPGRQHLYVPVELQGRAFDLVLDTGSEMTVIDDEIAEDLELRPFRSGTTYTLEGQTKHKIYGSKLKIAGGPERNAWVASNAVVLEGYDMDGTLGMLSLLTSRLLIDAKRRCVLIADRKQ
jgi:predicted aspartyl protease